MSALPGSFENDGGSAPRDRGLLLVFGLTLLFFLIELVGGLLFNSLSLVTDAAFMATNLLSQLLGLLALRLARRPRDARHPFGHSRAKVLAGLANGLLVGFVLFYVLGEAWRRLLAPEPITALPVLLIACAGFAINAYNLGRLYRERDDFALRGPFLLVLADTLSSAGVIAANIATQLTGAPHYDPIAAVLIGLLVAWPTLFLVRDSVEILMESTPSRIDQIAVHEFILARLSGARRLKGLRIWSITPDYVVLAVRVRTEERLFHRDEMKRLKRALKDRFGFREIYLEAYEEATEEI